MSPGETPGGPALPAARPELPATIGQVYDGFDDTHPNLQIATYVADSGTQISAILISGVLESDLTLEADVPYVLNGLVTVGADVVNAPATRPVTLTFLPGATVYAQGMDARLIVSAGSALHAEGRRDAPIILSSIAELERSRGLLLPEANPDGEWGGVIVNGLAPLAACDDMAAPAGSTACRIADADGVYGGGDRADGRGNVLRYVRIEYAGQGGTAAGSGLSLRGIGTSAQVSHIHVHGAGGHGLALRGGRANVTNMVISASGSDGFSWSQGWDGFGQNILLLHDGSGAALSGSGPPENAAFSSIPRLANVSLIGSESGETGISLAGRAIFLNGVISGFGQGILLSGQSSVDAVLNGSARIGSSLLNNATELIAPGNLAAVRTALERDGAVFASPLAGARYLPGPAPGDSFRIARLAAYPGLAETGYAGAFSRTETAASNWAAGWTRPGILLSETVACPEPTTQTGAISTKIICALSGRITRDLTLGMGDRIVYRLAGQVFVGSDGGPARADSVSSVQASLRIEPGVTLFGDGVSDGLVVTRGSKIFSMGSREAPVRFTSGAALRNETRPGTRAQWLGLTINGKAPINKCDVIAGAEGGSSDCQDDGEASSGVYGGALADDSSGTIIYTRVEYAGVFFTGEEQSNSIAFQGVGSGTRVAYVQVHNGGDDGVEFFGGTVGATHLVITGAGDDSVDWTDGWQGMIQYLIVEQSDGSNFCFEGDNRSVSDPDRTPRSMPVIANFTCIGNGGTSLGLRLREGTGGDFRNGIVVEVATGLDIDDASNALLLDAAPRPPDGARLSIASLFLDAATGIDEDDANSAQVRAAITDLIEADQTMSGFSFFGRSDTGVVPGANERNVTPAPSPDSDRFEDAPYAGAVRDGNDDWYKGWTIDASGHMLGMDR